MEQSSEERMGTIQEDAQELWNSLTNAKPALYDNAFQTELYNHYHLELQKLKASTAYTDFVRVLDNEGKRQFFENSRGGLSVQRPCGATVCSTLPTSVLVHDEVLLTMIGR